MRISFIYPYGGYVFYSSEVKKVKAEIIADVSENIEVLLTVKVKDYSGNFVFKDSRNVMTDKNGKALAEYELPLERLGYYNFSITAHCGDEAVEKSTGLGVTTEHSRSGFDSVFGVSCNFWHPEQDMPLYERVGIRFVRNPGKDTTVKWRKCIEKSGMYSQVQLQGNDMFFPQRFAHYKRNTAYYYQKQYGDVSRIIEHGNEHWEERDLGLLAEWVKSTGLARMEADPSAWHSGSGAAGVDINKMQVLYEQGMYDYITFIAIHAYSFPNRPESEVSFWSTKRLVDLADWMEKNNIDMPVCCTEQGYPAMYDQVKCESYSPGDLITLEAQIDYLVRSWLIFISYGVAKVLWFNGPWYEGFGIQEKDGPAPWPAMMALCQLIREVDNTEYIGDYEADEGVYFKVFRRKDGSLTAAVWKPIYYSRSCEKEKNLALDLTGTEADGTVKDKYEYTFNYIDKECFEVRDIMGNPIESDGKIIIGETPVYVSGIKEEIVKKLVNKTVFKTKTVKPRSMPPKVILGISDTKPYSEAYASSRFMPGESREYKVRIHNFSEEELNDTAIVEAPDCFTVSRTETQISVPPGQSRDFVLRVSCNPIAHIGEYKISVYMKNTKAHKAFQTAGVFSPLKFRPISDILKSESVLLLDFKNYSYKVRKYKLAFISPDIEFENSEITFTAASGQEITLPIIIKNCKSIIEPVVTAILSSDGEETEYHPVIPIDYIKLKGSGSLQYKIISGYDLMMTTGERYTGPELFGVGKNQTLNSTSLFSIDEKNLYCHFEVFDDTVVCAKNTRRNNIDSDGIWIRLYHGINDEKPYRHFSIVPADQAGRDEGCYVNEVNAGIKFASPFTDYDFKNIKVKSQIFNDRYTVDVEIDRKSIELWNGAKEVIMDIRIIDMNHDDWSRFYDTGKTVYKII